MSSLMKIPLEQTARDETEAMKISWNGGPFNFLLTRTLEKYKHKSVTERRLLVETNHNLKLPQLTDEMLLSLYKFACEKYMRRCRNHFGSSSGFYKTSSEIAFAATLDSMIRQNPKLKHLEIYPSQNHSKDLPPNFKMVVGNYVPDFLVFGLKIKGSSAVAIEIDGDSHVDKYSKDELRSKHLKEMKIFPFEVQNDQSKDFKFLSKSILDMYRLRTGSFNSQIRRAKRMIWVKTISCQLELEEIEAFVLSNFNIRLNLKVELMLTATSSACPRTVRREYHRLRKL